MDDIVPSDALLGRLKTEADRWNPSMFSVHRIRSLAYSTRCGTSKGPVFRMIWTLSTTSYVKCLANYTILANTWGMAGCFKTAAGGIYCHWQEALDYVEDCRERSEPLLRKYTEESVIAYLASKVSM